MLPKLFAADSVLRHSSWPQCLDRTWKPPEWTLPLPPKASNLLTWKKRVSETLRIASVFVEVEPRKKKLFAPQQLTAGTINILPHFQIALQQSAFYIQFWKVESSNWYFVSQSRTLSDFVTVARREQWKEKTERSSGACFLTVFEDYV